MHFVGFLRLAFYFSSWMAGAAIFPVALISAFCGVFFPVYLLVGYYSFRFFFPPKRWPYFKELMNLNIAPYCNKQSIVFEEGAEAPAPNSCVMTTVAPHGILTLGWSFLLSSTEYNTTDTKWLAAESLLLLPFIRDFMIWSDVFGATKECMTNLMAKGCNVALIPGGFQEATLYQRGMHRIYIKERKGFIKYALQFGYSIIPCYSFGEEWSYWQWEVGNSFRLWLNKFKIPATLFIGKYLFLPDNNIEVTVVVGKKITLPLIEKPTAEDVDKYHNLYIEQLELLFERNKAKYGASHCKLEMY